ncbi:hypothetical protein HK098_002189 [Nowakowskiella sp. JEL0407]|nr:hypothetical protein HK098_002189 [Nowakowskiella sp. JEL0407]
MPLFAILQQKFPNEFIFSSKNEAKKQMKQPVIQSVPDLNTSSFANSVSSIQFSEFLETVSPADNSSSIAILGDVNINNIQIELLKSTDSTHEYTTSFTLSPSKNLHKILSHLLPPKSKSLRELQFKGTISHPSDSSNSPKFEYTLKAPLDNLKLNDHTILKSAGLKFISGNLANLQNGGNNNLESWFLVDGVVSVGKVSDIPVDVQIWDGSWNTIPNQDSDNHIPPPNLNVKDVDSDDEEDLQDSTPDTNTSLFGMFQKQIPSFIVDESFFKSDGEVQWYMNGKVGKKEGVKLAQFVPTMGDSSMNWNLKDVVFTAATVDFKGVEGEMYPIKRGIQLYGVAEKPALLGKLFRKQQEKVNFALDFDGNKTLIKIILPEDESNIEFSEIIKAGPSEEIIVKATKTPIMKLKCGIELQHPKSNDTLVFKNTFSASKSGAKAIGSLIASHWTSPFGIKNLVIHDVLLQLDVDYVVLASTGLPKSIGIAGDLKIGSTVMKVATEIGIADPSKQMISGHVEKLPLKDVIGFALQLASGKFNKTTEFVDGPSDSYELETISKDYLVLETATLHICFEKTQIGSKVYEEGVSIQAEWKTIGRKTSALLHLSSSGVIARGTITSFSLGPLVVKGPESTPGSKAGKHDDAILEMHLTDTKQQIVIAGTIDLKGLKTSVTAVCAGLFTSTPRIKWTYMRNFFDLFAYEVIAETLVTEGSTDIDVVDLLKRIEFRLHAHLEQETLKPLVSVVSKFIQTTLNEIQKKVSLATNATSAVFAKAQTMNYGAVLADQSHHIELKDAQGLVSGVLKDANEVIEHAAESAEKDTVAIEIKGEDILILNITSIDLDATLNGILVGEKFKAKVVGEWKGESFVMDDIEWDDSPIESAEELSGWVASFGMQILSRLRNDASLGLSAGIPQLGNITELPLHFGKF